MRRLFALILVISLWFGFVQAAPAQASTLTPCRDNPAFIQRAKGATTAQAKARFDRYSQVMCGDEGLPHLIVDGSLAHAGEFLIPSALFLFIAGWIGWVGRAYLQWAKKTTAPEQKEIIIDVPKAIGFMLSGFAWPALALKEFTTGELTAKDDEVPISVR